MKKLLRSIDFLTATHDELDEYGMFMLVWDAPELSVILRGHLLIERVIEALISRKMKEPDQFFKKHRITFEMKVDLAVALGLLTKPHMSAAKALNNIRNSYAHREDHELTLEELNSFKIHWNSTQKNAYKMACTKGTAEAARIAIIFLNWSFLQLLNQGS